LEGLNECLSAEPSRMGYLKKPNASKKKADGGGVSWAAASPGDGDPGTSDEAKAERKANTRALGSKRASWAIMLFHSDENSSGSKGRRNSIEEKEGRRASVERRTSFSRMFGGVGGGLVDSEIDDDDGDSFHENRKSSLVGGMAAGIGRLTKRKSFVSSKVFRRGSFSGEGDESPPPNMAAAPKEKNTRGMGKKSSFVLPKLSRPAVKDEDLEPPATPTTLPVVPGASEAESKGGWRPGAAEAERNGAWTSSQGGGSGGGSLTSYFVRKQARVSPNKSISVSIAAGGAGSTLRDEAQRVLNHDTTELDHDIMQMEIAQMKLEQAASGEVACIGSAAAQAHLARRKVEREMAGVSDLHHNGRESDITVDPSARQPLSASFTSSGATARSFTNGSLAAKLDALVLADSDETSPDEAANKPTPQPGNRLAARRGSVGAAPPGGADRKPRNNGSSFNTDGVSPDAGVARMGRRPSVDRRDAPDSQPASRLAERRPSVDGRLPAGETRLAGRRPSVDRSRVPQVGVNS